MPKSSELPWLARSLLRRSGMQRSYVSSGRPDRFAALALLVAAAVGCGQRAQPTSGATDKPAHGPLTLTIGGYTTPREAYGAILPVFHDSWAKPRAQELTFKESYLGSGAQARAIAGGFEADVAALSLEPDIEVIRKAGLIKHDWKSAAHAGIVTRSIVVIGVRPGNPKNIHDWDDLAKPGLSVLTPNVRTSGGARWNIAAVWGAALRGKTSAKANDPAAASKLLGAILHNVKNMDAGARESLLQFERGVGDAIITYENEMLVGKQKGQNYEYVIPSSTILIENPVAVVDRYVDKHGSREVAEAFVTFLGTKEVQRIYAKHGLRPVDDEIAKENASSYPTPADLFTIRDIGDWQGTQKTIFDTGAAYDIALSLANGGA
jgi:sulfate/thiosulfate transport system substrate-binding protein